MVACAHGDLPVSLRRDCDAVGEEPASDGAGEVGEGPPAAVRGVDGRNHELGRPERRAGVGVLEPGQVWIWAPAHDGGGVVLVGAAQSQQGHGEAAPGRRCENSAGSVHRQQSSSLDVAVRQKEAAGGCVQQSMLLCKHKP